jgi:hypothetical protein
MKYILLLVVLAASFWMQKGYAQTTVNAATGGTGWKRVATVQGIAGRGFGRVTVYIRGGDNFAPNMIHIDWFKDWSSVGGVSVSSNSKNSPNWTEVRLTDDGTNSYIEVNFIRDIPSSSLSLMTDMYGWRPAELYSGILPDGGGTVRARAAVGRLSIENRFIVAYNGNVGIGTDDPQAKLAVDGTVLAKEVKVKNDITVPDYVFEPDYDLPALEEIEAYVKEHKHLPEIPSAAVIEKEGLNLAEMNLLLLKKVEELTLYMIEKDKVQQCHENLISQQNTRLQEQGRLIEQLEKSISVLLKSSDKNN